MTFRISLVSTFLITIAALTSLAGTVCADVRLPAFFNDHMVVQQQLPVKVWGWAEPAEEITVAFGGNQQTTKADTNGRWSIELPAMPANKTPQTMTISATNTIEIKDVLVGEVWLCSGQSNMEWQVRRCANAEAEIAAGNHPLIRHIKIPRRASAKPQIDIQADWQVCSTETVAEFSATAYFTAVNLQKELDVPIGLINSTWGGTRVEPWTAIAGFAKVDELKGLYQSTLNRTPGTANYQKLMDAHIAKTEKWLAEAKTNRQSDKVINPGPQFPAQLRPLAGRREATALYNGMIHPLVGLPIRGALWYQGEANHNEGMLYYHKKRALINGWRELWGQGDFHFYFVQIAPFNYGSKPEVLAEFWEAQAETLKVPNTGMVITNDITTTNNIHPPNKQDIGHRLALMALKDIYGKDDLVARSPEFESLKVLPGQLKVTFKSTGGELKTRDGKAPTLFEIVGVKSNGFQPATATIDGNSVTLQSDLVKSPVAFRFAWNKVAEPNLVGATGLPVGATRAGDVPTFLDLLPDGTGKEYQLVYELDLSKLGREIKYDVNRMAQFSSFDRIGYLVELESKEHGDQKVFVSMAAFTDDLKKIGIPTPESGASFQQALKSMEVLGNSAGVTSGSKIETGYIEFWPNNYDPDNQKGVAGASNEVYDFGDKRYGPANGYGSMQIHNTATGETIFAINHWKQGEKADIGIGNGKQHKDWTFSGNAANYESKNLKIFVRPKK